MTRPQMDGEKRRHPRFEVRPGVFGAVKSGAHMLGDVVDVSEGGLALTYVAELGSLVEEGVLHLFGSGGISYLKNAPVKTVSDIELPNDVPFSTIKIRRMGMEFGMLSDIQKGQLRGFIAENRAN